MEFESSYFARLRDEAETDIDSSIKWYEDQVSGLGGDFMREVANTVKYVEANPRLFQLRSEEIRWASLRRFPFVVVYRMQEHMIRILAIFHTSRNPQQLHSRNLPNR